MVKDILNAINIPYKKSRFLKPPKTTYAVYLDDQSRRGADNKNCITEHAITIEIYASKIDESVEKLIEKELDERNIFYDKQDWFYIDKELLFQLVYEFSYIEKGE